MEPESINSDYMRTIYIYLFSLKPWIISRLKNNKNASKMTNSQKVNRHNNLSRDIWLYPNRSIALFRSGAPHSVNHITVAILIYIMQQQNTETLLRNHCSHLSHVCPQAILYHRRLCVLWLTLNDHQGRWFGCSDVIYVLIPQRCSVSTSLQPTVSPDYGNAPTSLTWLWVFWM